jgi:hypothetical protein
LGVVIVTAALAWYDEAPEDLDRFVRALPVACDKLVAVDGGYERYPGAQSRSSSDERAAIIEAAADVGIAVDIPDTYQVWRGQVQKRTFLYQRALRESDWVFTLDADHILHGIREEVRHELATCGHDAVEVQFYTTMNHERPLADTASTEWHENLAGKSIWHRMLFRALPGMRVERFHWYISALRETERVWLTAVNENVYPVVTSNRLMAPFLVEHRCLFRRDRNIIANRDFCNDRVAIVTATGQEDAA